MSTTPQPTPNPWLAALSRNRRQTAYVLFGLAVFFALLALWMAYKYHWEYASVAAWGGFLALFTATGGLWLLSVESQDMGDVDAARTLVLVLGGLSGMVTWVMAIALAYKWRSTVFGGIDAWQGESWWQLWVCALALFAGLVVMFASLLLARSVERTNPLLRRLLYGYNTLLSGLLLLAVLAIVNVLIYNYLTASYDWTESSIYTLSDKSINVLKGLEKPTKISVIVPMADDFVFGEVHTLMDNVRAVSDKIRVEYLLPDRNFDRIAELRRRYQFTDRAGILVVYGESQGEQAAPSEFQFIRYEDLVSDNPERSNSRQSRQVFKGEDALISALSQLEEGKERTTIYFTQGNGELDLKDSDASQPGKGAGALRERLQKASYNVKALEFVPAGTTTKGGDTVASNRVPPDADIVIIAGAATPLPAYALKALEEFMSPVGPEAVTKKKGKLVVLADLTVDASGAAVRTGLEDFLARFNVQLGDDRVLSIPETRYTRNPSELVVLANPRSNNPVASSLGNNIIRFRNVRSVGAAPSNPSMPAGFSADPLLYAFPRQGVIVEKNLRADTTQLVADLLKAGEETLDKRISKELVSVAVSVAESQAPSPNDPHAFMRPTAGKPRVAVFGCSEFASNAYMLETRESINFPLLSGTLAWLRERPATIGVEPKKRNTFTLNTDKDVIDRMIWLPVTILLVGIIGLGTGVWVVRRR